VRKVFIVARGRADIYGSLCRALESEGDVLVIYDRRSPALSRRRSPWSIRDMYADLDDRRRRSDIDDEIRERGFGVVHLAAGDQRDEADDEALDALEDE
jgi:hypothetical protein